MISANLAQDVWKDPGLNVSFVVLNLKRMNLQEDQSAMATFFDRSQAIIRSMRIRNPQDNLQVAIGLSQTAWKYLFPHHSVPKELENYQTLTGPKYSMPASGGDLFLHIRAAQEAVVYEVLRQMMIFLRPITSVLDETKGFRFLEGRSIIGFMDGTEAPALEDAAEYALIGAEDPDYENGSYAFAQKWQHNMAFWEQMSVEKQEQAVGRKKFDDLELADYAKSPNAHNVASKLEVDGIEQKIIRMNVPFSNPALDFTGTYFIGYARHWLVTKAMLEQMLAQSDFLLTFSEILSGQLFFIPSRPTLIAMADGEFF
ncbi:Dyp-type peroxidase [Weissella coleopterorum]|uniref:Dyp-type peroxidase n=1 Tax=Weissella coleopterorum TaxID=2714949 RepID=A0A6G8AZD1_9LACO|nr:Dyp-type peroxidase [Weissella coleopterorum]QIL50340.1 Dyp-type peroxidase [Weissella coleopterorum]